MAGLAAKSAERRTAIKQVQIDGEGHERFKAKEIEDEDLKRWENRLRELLIGNVNRGGSDDGMGLGIGCGLGVVIEE